MEMEFVAFYPDTKTEATILGTAHVRVYSKEDPIIDFDIRGIQVFLTYAHKLMVQVKGHVQFDPKAKRNVRFSIFTFSSDAVQKRLQNLVKSEYAKWKREHPEFVEHTFMKKSKRTGQNPNYKPSEEQKTYEKRYTPSSSTYKPAAKTYKPTPGVYRPTQSPYKPFTSTYSNSTETNFNR